MQKTLFTLFAALLTSAAYYYSIDFHRIWWLTWLAPIPLLLMIKRLNWMVTVVVCFVVGASTVLSSAIGYAGTLIPWSSNITPALTAGCQFALIFSLTAYWQKNKNTWPSIFIFPCLFSLCEGALAFTDLGTYQSFAYNQLFFLPVAQIASVGGYIAITFTLCLFASTIAYIIDRDDAIAAQRCKAAVVGFIVIGLVLLFGVIRLEQTQSTGRIKVGLAYKGYPITTILKSSNALMIAKSYIPIMTQLAEQGAKIIMIPEESMVVSEKQQPEVIKLFSTLSHRLHVRLIIGVRQKIHKTYNTAWLFSANGKLIGQYRKRHFVPGVELGMTAGKKLLHFNVNGYRFAIAICRDLDYRHPSADYGRQGVNVLFVPAWDFDVDAWVHGRMAIMRGVEYGFSVVRAARGGYLHVASNTGRIIQQTVVVSSQGNNHLLVNVPITTNNSFYAEHPHAFIIMLFILLFGVIGGDKIGNTLCARFNGINRGKTGGERDGSTNKLR